MPRTARLTDALRGRSKALVLVGAAAALTGAGAASAATVGTSQPTALSGAASVAGHYSLASSASSSYDSLAGPQQAAVATAAHEASVVHRAAAAHQTAAARQAPATHRVAEHRTSGHPAERRRTGARHAAHARRRTMPARNSRSYLIYDSVTPSAIPAHHEIATYADGGYAVSPAQVAGKKVLWIDTNGSDPRASALDVEPGDATPTEAATWASEHLRAEPHDPAIIYTMRSDWPAAQAAVSALPTWMQHNVKWWIADPTGVPHVVPGASATQWYWGSNYDITTATAGL
jgi:hypothetical protein